MTNMRRKQKRKRKHLFVKETMTFIFFLALFLISLLCPLITYSTVNIKMAFNFTPKATTKCFLKICLLKILRKYFH